ncbi:unnamed protein product [Ilex paraguariensis]|uniref:Alcohol dehydrogenase n=1 Tax=Ilex paraguariensis TaxID=185542 RepID=A0ABC8S3X5_9AQUA
MENNCRSETAGKPIICKAAVCRKAGEALVIEDIEVAPPKAWEVRIKILCTSLCHSDVTMWKLELAPIAFFPRIFGHEAVGIVESVGEHVEEVEEGELVVPVFERNCGECRDCKSHKSNNCSKFPTEFYGGMPRDGTSRFKDLNGEVVHHFFSVSSFSQYTVVDITHVAKLNCEIPIDKACLLSCGVTTGVGAAWEVAKVEEGSTVAIFGLGAIGLASVGEHVEEVEEGELVVPVFERNCGECRDCKSHKSNNCSKFPTEFYGGMPRDGTSRFKDLNGEVVHHFFSVSSFSQYTVVDITHVAKLNCEIPIDKACLLSCGVTTGVGAAWEVAKVEEGSSVAIFGLGAIGLAVAEGARLRGASKIIGVDLNPEKFEIGKKFGVTDFVNPTSCGEKSVSRVIQEMTDGGADYCFECVGLASVMQDAFNSSRKGWGKTVILGIEMHGSPISIHPYTITEGRSVEGSRFGGMKAKSDIPMLAKKYLDRELTLDGFVTHEVGFQDINKAFDLLLQGKSLRCIIWMDR